MLIKWSLNKLLGFGENINLPEYILNMLQQILRPKRAL